MELDARQSDVSNYYGEVLQSSSDLKTSACCTLDAVPAHQRAVLDLIHDEILDKFYGCGSPLPSQLAGCTVLDLGCGTGRDSYIASKLVGAKGQVIGVDMTAAQLDVAKRHLGEQMARFQFSDPNIRFEQGTIEDLAALGIEDQSVDVVISNCVINLSGDKRQVFKEIFRVLKVGGELYFADIFCDRRLSEEAKQDPVLVGECLGGALYIEDFRRMLRDLGCLDYRIVATSEVKVEDPELRVKLGDARFYSLTVRAFKLNVLEDLCEDYGQQAVYLGTMCEHPDSFVLDDHHEFKTDQPAAVCGNTASMLSETRFGAHFRIIGDRSAHHGPFDCGPVVAGVSPSCC